MKKEKKKTYLPTITAIHTLAKCRHRFIGTSCLRLGIADFLLLALAALQTVTDALLRHRYLGLLHVLLLQLDFHLALVVALEFLVRHVDKFLGRNFSCHYSLAQFPVRLVLEICEERSDLLLVVGGLAPEERECGALDGNGPGNDVGLGLDRSVGQAIVNEADALVSDVRLGPLDAHAIGIEFSFLGIALERLLGAAGGGGVARWVGRRCGRGSRRGAHLCLLQLGVLLLLDKLLPLNH